MTIDDTQRPNAPTQLTAKAATMSWYRMAPSVERFHAHGVCYRGGTDTKFAIRPGGADHEHDLYRRVCSEWKLASPGARDLAWRLSDPSNHSVLITAPCSQAPGPPTELSAMAISHTVTLRWRRPSVGSAADYTIEAGSIPGAADLAQQRVGGPIDSAELVAPLGVYFARLRAHNACGTSGPSNEVTVFVP